MILELCKGVHCVDLDESFQTHIYLQNLASIQPRTSPLKFVGSRAVRSANANWRLQRARRHLLGALLQRARRHLLGALRGGAYVLFEGALRGGAYVLFVAAN